MNFMRLQEMNIAICQLAFLEQQREQRLQARYIQHRLDLIAQGSSTQQAAGDTFVTYTDLRRHLKAQKEAKSVGRYSVLQFFQRSVKDK